MSDDDSPRVTPPSREIADHDEQQMSRRDESVIDRIDRINRGAFQRVVCRRIASHSERTGR